MLGTILTGLIAVAILILIVVGMGYIRPEHEVVEGSTDMPEGCKTCGSRHQCH